MLGPQGYAFARRVGEHQLNEFRLIEDDAGLRLDATSPDLDAQPLR